MHYWKLEHMTKMFGNISISFVPATQAVIGITDKIFTCIQTVETVSKVTNIFYIANRIELLISPPPFTFLIINKMIKLCSHIF